ncbi:MAG: NUDIX hydrolase [Arenicellales bacterium]|jgi:8-oxo-dGTP pyrophosphatase MutT (NUDIX family)|nr:NUDIX hydrolase [Arenicellales bacterium]
MSKDDVQLIASKELQDLESRYGGFSTIATDLEMASRSLRFYRKAFKNRRGEILFVLRRSNGDLLLHTKHKYPPDLYRIPGGGIDWEEPVPASLRREVWEETQFKVSNERFLGLIRYRFHSSDPEESQEDVHFVSFVFEIPDIEGEPAAEDASEGISGFRWIPVSELSNVAHALKALPDDKSGSGDWGRFRAVGHDFVLQHLK